MRNLLHTLLLLAHTQLLHAQENLSTSQQFFEKAAITYQNWLDASGLGPALQVRSAEVKNDTLLVVFLGFQVSDTISVNAAWTGLRAAFFEKTGGEVLENVLFDKIGWYFEVPARQTRLYINDNIQGIKARCWEARMVPNDLEQPVFQEKNYNCMSKSQDFPVSIGPQDLGGLRPPTKEGFQIGMNKKAVFKKLEGWLTERFQKPQPDGGWSHIRFTDRWATLKFEVTDLRREVISTAESSWLCEALCFCPTCLPVERLEVVLKFQNLDDDSGGFELTATISAMYGSGIFKPREGGYHDLDAEPAKKALLKNYGERLMFDIKNFLLQP